MNGSAASVKPGAVARDGQDIWLICGGGSFVYALPLARVIQVMPLLPIETFAGALACVRGLSIIRGSPTLVVDVALLFGGSGGRSQRLVTIHAGARTIALAVERVMGVRSIAPDLAGEPLPPLLRDAASEMVSAIGRLDAELLLFLDTARIVPDTLLGDLAAVA